MFPAINRPCLAQQEMENGLAGVHPSSFPHGQASPDTGQGYPCCAIGRRSRISGVGGLSLLDPTDQKVEGDRWAKACPGMAMHAGP